MFFESTTPGYLSARVSDTRDNKVCDREVCGQIKNPSAFPGIEEVICSY